MIFVNISFIAGFTCDLVSREHSGGVGMGKSGNHRVSGIALIVMWLATTITMACCSCRAFDTLSDSTCYIY